MRAATDDHDRRNGAAIYHFKLRLSNDGLHILDITRDHGPVIDTIYVRALNVGDLVTLRLAIDAELGDRPAAIGPPDPTGDLAARARTALNELADHACNLADAAYSATDTPRHRPGD